MFTGLIETMGTIVRTRQSGESVEIGIRADTQNFGVSMGASVAIDGTCLTVERTEGALMIFTAVKETLSRTTLAQVTSGRKVNLERALQLGGRLDGHLVLGHVDGIGEILTDRKVGLSTLRTIKVPEHLSKYMAEKGSVAIDGISLTIAASTATSITISLIPHTISATTMSLKRPHDRVNLECDCIARYVHRLISSGAGNAYSEESHKISKNQESILNSLERLGF